MPSEQIIDVMVTKADRLAPMTKSEKVSVLSDAELLQMKAVRHLGRLCLICVSLGKNAYFLLGKLEHYGYVVGL